MEPAQERDRELARVLLAVDDFEGHALSLRTNLLRPPIAKLDAGGRDARKRLRYQLANDRTVHARHDEPGARHNVDQTTERRLQSVQVGIDIGVIELYVFQQNDSRQVVQELGTLVEEGDVVFVAFNDEVRT